MRKSHIDGGREFDFGKTSIDYAKYRDIYPQEFYDKILEQGLCKNGQRILDIGTGTGVLPRNLYRYGGKFVGLDISENQIEVAKSLAQSQDMDVDFICASAEDMNFQSESFDLVTACQCFTYFNHDVLAQKISKVLKAKGKFVALYMAWLPYEDPIAAKSEELILKYNPSWTGCGETRRYIEVPSVYGDYFTLEHEDIFDLDVRFDRDSWHGRMRTCRGVGASLSPALLAKWESEHRRMLDECAAKEFYIKHYGAICVLTKNNTRYFVD